MGNGDAGGAPHDNQSTEWECIEFWGAACGSR